MIFIECKTKRLKLSSRTSSDPEILEKDIAALAKAVTQHYQNIKPLIHLVGVSIGLLIEK